MMKTMVLFAMLCVGTAFSASWFKGKGGLLIIEAESTKSSLGQWDKKKEIEGYTGEYHVKFTGTREQELSESRVLRK